VRELEAKSHVLGIGLFGSWSRGEATSASDVDLLILDDSNLKDEYVERINPSGLMVDLDRVPKQWINTVIPPDMDQKLYELQIFFDRDWALANTKLLMAKFYVSAERVSIRTEAHVADLDIYLSRATSAFSREDYRSAFLFSIVALESVLKVLIEIALLPFSNSHFVERLEASTAKLSMPDLFNEYVNLARLEEVKASIAKEKLKLFSVVWDEMSNTVRRHPQKRGSSHFRIRARLNYYLTTAFLQGIITRSNFMIDNEKLVESLHYLKTVFINAVENYAWLKSSIDKTKIDNTLLIRSLESLEKKNPKNYERIVDFLDLKNIERLDAARAIRRTKEVMFRVRRDRKVLIKNNLTKS